MSEPNAQAAPLCDFGAARKFLHMFDPTAERWTFQTFDDVILPDGKLRGDKSLVRVLVGPLDDAMVGKLVDLNGRGAGIYFTVNEAGGRRKKLDIKRVRAVWIDWDNKTGKPRVVVPSPPPSFVVETSPGHTHEYWRCEGLTFAEHAGIMETMCEKFGSDPGTKDLPRVLRLPGFYHCKNPDNRHLVKLTHVRPLGGFSDGCAPPYLRDVILNAFPFTPKPEAEPTPPREPGTFDRANVFQLLGYIDAHARKTWRDVGFALHHESRGSLEGYALWNDWSANAPDKYDADDIDRTWKSFSGRTDKPITVGTLYHMAKEGGWKEQRADPLDGFTEAPGADAGEQDDDADADKLLERVSDIDKDALLADAGNALIRPWLMRGNTGMIYGDSTGGKTFTALDMAFHLALGKDWHGHRIKKRVPVLYVCLEGTKGFQRRMWAAEKVHGDPGDYFSRLTVHVSLAKGKGLSDEEAAKGAKTIIRAARRLAKRCGEPCGVIYIDTLRRATAGDDENATDAIMFFIEKRCGHIQRETGAAVFYLHHTNRQGTYAGNSSNTGGNDVVIRVERNGDPVRNVWLEKDKDGEEKGLLAFELDVVPLGEDDEKVPITSCVVRKVASTPDPAAKNAKRVRRIGKTERAFCEAFDAVRAAGKLTERTTTVGCNAGVTAEIPDVQAAFLERYKTGNPERQWRRAMAELPQGFEIIKLPVAPGADNYKEFIWSPI